MGRLYCMKKIMIALSSLCALVLSSGAFFYIK